MKRNRDHQRMLEDVRDTDLRQIDAIWDLSTEKSVELRPSNRHAIRQGCIALDRLGERLASVLSIKGVTGHTSFPVVTPNTRFRRVPKRLLLEFFPQKPSQVSNATPNLFVEFTAASWCLGLSVSSFASNKENEIFWKRLRISAPSVFKDLQDGLRKKPNPAGPGVERSTGWCVAPYCAPLPQGTSSMDLNSLLKKHSKDKGRTAHSFIIRKTSDAPCPSFSVLADELIDTIELFGLAQMIELDIEASASQTELRQVPMLAKVQ